MLFSVVPHPVCSNERTELLATLPKERIKTRTLDLEYLVTKLI